MVACSWAQAAEPSEQQKLLALLSSDASRQQKQEACQRLAAIGTKEAVPTLAGLLATERLSHGARIALEAIPDPAAVEALRNAIPQLKGHLLIGVVNSVGVRRDVQSLATLRGLITDADPQVACAAAAAVGKIGTPEAAKLLTPALTSTEGEVREAVGRACLRCAELLAGENNRPASLAVYDSVRQADVSERIRAAAIRGIILGRPPVGEGALAETLKSQSPIQFAMGLRVACEVRDPAMTQVLLAQVPALPLERQSLVIRVLGDRADAAARPAVVEALKNASPEIRAAAAQALATLGDRSTINALLAAAVDANTEVAATARDSLAALGGEGVDAALVDLLGKAEGSSRLVVLEVVGRRHVRAAVPVLIPLADSPDAGLRRAAIAALGRTVTLEQLPMLIERYLKASKAEDTAAALAALKGACTQISDKQRCAQMLVEHQAQVPTAGKCALYEMLGSLGGPHALKAVVDGAKNPDEKARDVATRVLGDWPTIDAAEPLLQLAKSMAESRYRSRALRGYLRIARQMDLSDRTRLEMGRAALAQAERDEERALAFDALSRVPSVQALELVVPHLKTESLKTPACVAAVTIAEKLQGDQVARAVEPMKQVIEATTDKNLVRRANEVIQRAQAGAPKP
jgi:HEAT repeat protein